MKIGFSFSRCVRDIVDGNVSIDEILVIISRTDFNPHDDVQWSSIWKGYRTRLGWAVPEWEDYDALEESRFRQITTDLYVTGKLHQPRQFGIHPILGAPYVWMDVIPEVSNINNSPALKEAWDHFQVVAGLLGATNKDAEDF